MTALTEVGPERKMSLALGPSAEAVPVSVALRHSTMWEEYGALPPQDLFPLAPVSGVVLGQNLRLISAVNVRRLGQSDRGLTTPSSIRAASVVDMVIRCLTSA